MLYHFSGRTNVWGGRAGCGALCGVCVEDGGMIKKAYLLGAQLNASPVDCGVCDSPGPDWIQVMKLLFAYWQVNNHLIPESRVSQKGGPPPLLRTCEDRTGGPWRGCHTSGCWKGSGIGVGERGQAIWGPHSID